MFEGRTDQAGIPLKTAHKLLHGLGAKAKLVPGEAMMALPRVANSFTGVDLLVIAADQEAAGVEAALGWIPRMLHEKTLVLWEKQNQGTGNLSFDRYTSAQISEMAGCGVARAA